MSTAPISAAPAAPAAPPAPVLAPLEKREDKGAILYAGSILSAAAGMVNMYGFYELGVLLSHQTGNTCHLSRQVEVELWVKLFLSVSGFVLGSMAAGYWGLDFESFMASSRSVGLAVAGGAVLVGTLMQWQMNYQTHSAIVLLGFSQGLQNGITTACKAMPVRTTHITGCFTDFGLIAGQYLKAKVKGGAAINPWKPSLLVLCVIFFGIGGLIEKLLLDSIGELAGLAPAIIMLLSAGGALVGPINARRKKSLLAQQKQYGTAP